MAPCIECCGLSLPSSCVWSIRGVRQLQRLTSAMKVILNKPQAAAMFAIISNICFWGVPLTLSKTLVTRHEGTGYLVPAPYFYIPNRYSAGDTVDITSAAFTYLRKRFLVNILGWTHMRAQVNFLNFFLERDSNMWPTTWSSGNSSCSGMGAFTRWKAKLIQLQSNKTALIQLWSNKATLIFNCGQRKIY